MPQQLDCLRCHTPMVEGFVPYLSEHGYRTQIWHPGEPQKSFWAGLKMKKDLCIPIHAARCPNCGYLEFYAAK